MSPRGSERVCRIDPPALAPPGARDEVCRARRSSIDLPLADSLHRVDRHLFPRPGACYPDAAQGSVPILMTTTMATSVRCCGSFLKTVAAGAHATIAERLCLRRTTTTLLRRLAMQLGATSLSEFRQKARGTTRDEPPTTAEDVDFST